MRAWWPWLWVPLVVLVACAPAALRLQREARDYFQVARLAESRTTGHQRAHAALCRETAARVEGLAYDSYPSVSPPARDEAAHLRQDCRDFSGANVGVPVDLGPGRPLPDLAPGLPSPDGGVAACSSSLCGGAWEALCQCHGESGARRCWATQQHCQQDAACCTARGGCKGTAAGEDTCSRQVRALGTADGGIHG